MGEKKVGMQERFPIGRPLLLGSTFMDMGVNYPIAKARGLRLTRLRGPAR